MAGTKLGDTTFETYLLNRAEVSGVIVDTINTVEGIVAEAVSTAWKAGGSQYASAFSTNALLTEANEGKVYNLLDALTITDANKQYFTENATGSYPAGTNVAVIETTPATYAAASGTAVSGTQYYEKHGNNYVPVTVPAGSSVSGLYVRTGNPAYKYDVLAGSDSTAVRQINVDDNESYHQYTPNAGVVTIPFADGTGMVDGFMSSGQAAKLENIEARANVGFNLISGEAESISAVSGATSVVFSGTGAIDIDISAAAREHSGARVVVSVSGATTSHSGVVRLADTSCGWESSTEGVATASGVVAYIGDTNKYNALDVHYHSGSYVRSGQATASGNGTIRIVAGSNMTASITDGQGFSDTDIVNLDAVVPVKAIKVAGLPSDISPDSSGAVTIPSGTSLGRGVVKLYPTASSNAKDGAVTQSGVHAISGAVTNLDNYSAITVKNFSGMTAKTSGAANPSTNSDALSIETDWPISGSVSTKKIVLQAKSATADSKGVVKLYTAVSTANDGAVTPKAVSGAIAGIRNYSRITTKYQTWRSGETPTTEWHSGSVAPATNSSAVTIYGEGSVQVSNPYGSIAISVARPDNEHDWPGVVTVLDTVGDTTEASCGVTASPKMVTESSALRVKKSITLSGLRQVSNDTQTPIPASINPTDMPNTLYGLIKALKFAANHAS